MSDVKGFLTIGKDAHAMCVMATSLSPGESIAQSVARQREIQTNRTFNMSAAWVPGGD